MRLAIVSTLLAVAATAVPAQEAGAPSDDTPNLAAPDAAAIEAVIADQLGDFNDRDVAGAWAHASPMIQGIFGSAANFGTMVEQGYPMVWTNTDARFLDLREEMGALRQKVLIADAAGRPWILDYEMVPSPEGWLINGVEVLPAPDLAA